MLAVGGFAIHKGWLAPAAQAAMAADIAARGRGRALLRAADAVGQADERADDLGRPLRLVHRPQGLPLRRPPPRRARPGRRSRRRCSRSGARSSRRTRIPTAASSTTIPADGADGDAPRRRRGGLLLAGPLDQPRRQRALPHGRHRAQRPDDRRPARVAATSWSSAARPASPTTASTASAPAARRCCRRAAGST